jgi:hypothetical protein
MFERRVGERDVEHVLNKGRVIAEYPEDKPFPSRLVLGWIKGRPLHVVAADDHEHKQTIVITVYEPEATQWEEGFIERKKP